MDSRAKYFGPASGFAVGIKRAAGATRFALSDLWYREELRCTICEQHAKTSVCDTCRDEYFLPSHKRCRACGKILPEDFASVVCSDCSCGKGPVCFDDVAVLGHYTGFWREWIQRVKFQSQPFLLASLAEYLAHWAVRQLPPPDLVVPVPMHENRWKERGFNQTEVLASVLCGFLGLRWKRLLQRTKATESQTSLSREKRLLNVSKAFACSQKQLITGKRLWLVDDVITTGATIGECGKVLREAGCQSLYGLALAAGKEIRQSEQFSPER